LFGGYPTYQAPYFQRLVKILPGFARNASAAFVRALPVSHGRISLDYRLKRFAAGMQLSPERAHASWREVLNVEGQREILTAEATQALDGYDPYINFDTAFSVSGKLEDINRFMHADIHTYLLNDHLRKIDRMSMLNSVEAREPLLDVNLVEFAMRLPAKHKISLRRTKRILREIARPVLPSAVVAGSKKGLTPPIPTWIFNDLRQFTRDQLRGGLVGNLLKPGAVDGLLKAHQERRADNSRLIWALLSLQIWGRRANVAA
jgi:asparagine synthase (glutamine-hydrolysing)